MELGAAQDERPPVAGCRRIRTSERCARPHGQHLGSHQARDGLHPALPGAAPDRDERQHPSLGSGKRLGIWFDPPGIALHQNAKSYVGASGLMQLMPSTAKYVAKKIGLTEFTQDQINDINTNLLLGTSYLNMVLNNLDGSQALATAAYN